MTQAYFEIAYDGPALRDHAMDVDQLAPALLAIGDLCREANRVLNGEKGGVSVRVVADFERKCFDIHFQLVQTFYEQIKDLVTDEHVATAKTVLEWLGFLGAPSLVSLLSYRKLKQGRPIKSETKIVTENGGTSYVMTFEGSHNSVTISEPVHRLSLDRGVSRAEKAVVRPLLSGGIDRLVVRQAGAEINEVSKSDAKFFGDADVSSKEDFAEPMEITVVLELRSPVFVEGEKWYFNFGDQRISADITDRRFINRVFVYGERFGAGDKLKAQLRIFQTQTSGGKIKNSYEILNVLEVWEAKDQPALPFE